MRIAIVIPAYNPTGRLSELTSALRRHCQLDIIVVDDGSAPASGAVFNTLLETNALHVVHHAVNLGKGAALKTGFNYALCTFPDLAGVVTADADGQHDCEDILNVVRALQENPCSLVLGIRRFGRQVPLRSRIGNIITRFLVRMLVGQRMSDCQTGLRGIPAQLLPRLLRISSLGYEFELDALIAAKHHACPIREIEINTIYIDGNRSSHFNPVVDSLRIYFVLLRFSGLSILTAVIDNLIFFLFISWTGAIGRSQVVARLVALFFNYFGLRTAVFLSSEPHSRTLPAYLALVALSGGLSYALIEFLVSWFSIPVMAAKLIAESILFLANFALQRDFVFTKRREPASATDWDLYYRRVPSTARLTRRYTTSALTSAFRKYVNWSHSGTGDIVELGGANSCFVDHLVTQFKPSRYHVLDVNQYGLSLLAARTGINSPVELHPCDVVGPLPELSADVVFSVGLIEHFDMVGTSRAVISHFDLAKAGGCVVISYPTPTWLYRIARATCEAMNLWRFPDERPLRRAEVIETVQQYGEVLETRILWPLVFTQQLIVARKR